MCSTGVDRTSHRYRSCRPDDAAVRTGLRELAGVRRRFGYRRLLVLMRREGLTLWTLGFWNGPTLGGEFPALSAEQRS